MGKLELDISKGTWSDTFPPPPGHVRGLVGWINNQYGNIPIYAFSNQTSPAAGYCTGLFSCYGANGTQYFFLGWSNGKIYRTTDFASYTDVTNVAGNYYSGGHVTAWSFAVYGNWLIATNGVDDNPQVLKNIDSAAPKFVDLGGTPPKAAYVIVHSQSGQVILGNVTSYPKRITFSAFQNAEDFTTTTNGAGNQDFPDASGNISGLTQLSGSGIVVAFDRGLVYGQWTGVNGLWWGFNPPINGRGAFGGALVATPEGQAFMCDKYGVTAFDGRTVTPVDTGIREGLLNTPLYGCYGVVCDPAIQSIYWLLVKKVASTYTDSYFIFNYKTGSWSLALASRGSITDQSLNALTLKSSANVASTNNIDALVICPAAIPTVMDTAATINNSLISNFIGDHEKVFLIQHVAIVPPYATGDPFGSSFSATLQAYDASYTAITNGSVLLNSSNFNSKTGLWDVQLSGNFFAITLTNVTPNTGKLIFTKVLLFTSDTDTGRSTL